RSRPVPGAVERLPHRVGGRTLTLDQIEQTILAPFNDPRLFLALGRGAVSSGRLRSEAYSAGQLEQQLVEVAHECLSRPECVQLDREGGKVSCNVTICARGEAGLSAAADHLRRLDGAAERVLSVRADVSTEQGVADVIEQTAERFGGLDILVNNVGAAGGSDIVNTTDRDWQRAFDETLFPAIRASRLAVPLMRRRGGGAIVMIASSWGRESGGPMPYSAVKAAEISLAKAMAPQLAR